MSRLWPDEADEFGETPEADLWFLPGPVDDAPHAAAEAAPDAVAALSGWARAEAGCAAHLARVASGLGALDERLRRGPAGRRHRLALIEAAELSWIAGDRVAPDRLALWLALRLPGVQDDTAALARAGWAVRRLVGGPGPEAGSGSGLGAFLGRHDPGDAPAPFAAPFVAPLAHRAEGWRALMAAGRDLHPVTRACAGFHLWARSGPGREGDRLEAAVMAGRIAAGAGRGAVFAPLAMDGAAGASGALRPGGDPAARLGRWLDGMAAPPAPRCSATSRGWRPAA